MPQTEQAPMRTARKRKTVEAPAEENLAGRQHTIKNTKVCDAILKVWIARYVPEMANRKDELSMLRVPGATPKDGDDVIITFPDNAMAAKAAYLMADIEKKTIPTRWLHVRYGG